MKLKNGDQFHTEQWQSHPLVTLKNHSTKMSIIPWLTAAFIVCAIYLVIFVPFSGPRQWLLNTFAETYATFVSGDAPTTDAVPPENATEANAGALSGYAATNEAPACTAHKDENEDHLCDNGCGRISECADSADEDHLCDLVLCRLPLCKDDNLDHKCDSCGVIICADVDGQHRCRCCGSKLGHTDVNNDHACDYPSCSYKSACADANRDHYCDTCEKFLPNAHVDANPADHYCDIEICKMQLSVCSFRNDYHRCDVCDTERELPEEDLDFDHLCDACGRKMSECTDKEPQDLRCDWCGKPFYTNTQAVLMITVPVVVIILIFVLLYLIVAFFKWLFRQIAIWLYGHEQIEIHSHLVLYKTRRGTTAYPFVAIYNAYAGRIKRVGRKTIGTVWIDYAGVKGPTQRMTFNLIENPEAIVTQIRAQFPAPSEGVSYSVVTPPPGPHTDR